MEAPKGVTVDSAFLVDHLRDEPQALAKSDELAGRREPLFLTTPVIYGVVTGLLFSRSRIQASAFRPLAHAFTILPFDEPAAERGAEIRAELMRDGTPGSGVDIMIAAIASLHGHSVVTRDAGFRTIPQIAQLDVEAY